MTAAVAKATTAAHVPVQIRFFMRPPRATRAATIGPRMARPFSTGKNRSSVRFSDCADQRRSRDHSPTAIATSTTRIPPGTMAANS
jgi:hypothetical protein